MLSTSLLVSDDLGIVISVSGFGAEGIGKETESILFSGTIMIGDNFALTGILLKAKMVFETGSEIELQVPIMDHGELDWKESASSNVRINKINLKYYRNQY